MFNVATTKRSTKFMPQIRGSSGLFVRQETAADVMCTDEKKELLGSLSQSFARNLDFRTHEPEIPNISTSPLIESPNDIEPKLSASKKKAKPSISETTKSEIKNSKERKLKAEPKKDYRKLNGNKPSYQPKKSESLPDSNSKRPQTPISSVNESFDSGSVKSSELRPPTSTPPTGFDLTAVTLDANSLFRCISKHFHNDQNSHHSVRQKAVACIRKNRDLFKNISASEFDSYLDRNNIPNVPPDENILQAISLSYKVNLFIYCEENKKFKIIECPKKSKSELFLIKNSFYYSLLTKTSETSQEQIPTVEIKPQKVKVDQKPIPQEKNEEDTGFFEMKRRQKRKSKSEKPFSIISPIVEVKVSDLPAPSKSISRGNKKTQTVPKTASINKINSEPTKTQSDTSKPDIQEPISLSPIIIPTSKSQVNAWKIPVETCDEKTTKIVVSDVSNKHLPYCNNNKGVSSCDASFHQPSIERRRQGYRYYPYEGSKKNNQSSYNNQRRYQQKRTVYKDKQSQSYFNPNPVVYYLPPPAWYYYTYAPYLNYPYPEVEDSSNTTYYWPPNASYYVPPHPGVGYHPEDDIMDDMLPGPVNQTPRYKVDEPYEERLEMYQCPNSTIQPPIPTEKDSTKYPDVGRFLENQTPLIPVPSFEKIPTTNEPPLPTDLNEGQTENSQDRNE